MVVADLHTHTTNSDGTLPMSEVPTAARRAGLDAVAVTDHDRPHPDLDEPIERREDVTVVHGIELRVEADTQRVDLLGYGLDPTPDLEAECDRLQADREQRARRIVACVEDRLDVDLEVTPGPGTGRPHVARAIADHPDLDYDVDRAFDELIGNDCPCYVARDVPSFERGRELLAESCRLIGLAHPLRYDDPEAALALCRDLDAAELYYPYDRPVDPSGGLEAGPVQRTIERFDLLATGGSDAHGRALGGTGLDGDAYRPVRSALLDEPPERGA